MAKKQHFDWIDIAKGIAIVLVVMGHSFPDASAVGGVRNVFLRGVHDVIYQFHMPLMFFISGILSGKIIKLQNGAERVAYVKDRFLRLMVPYFAIAFLYLPFKLLLSKFANQPYDISGIWKLFLGENPDGGLWFLYVLFLAQVVMCFLVRKDNLRLSAIASVLVATLITVFDTKWFRIDDAIFYICFVVAGLYYANNGTFEKKMSLGATSIAGLLLVVSVSVFLLTESLYCRLFSGFFGTALIIGVSRNINVHTIIGRTLTTLGQYTMDIYIFHGILMVMVRILFYSVLGWNYYLCCAILFFVGLVVPVLLSKYIVRKVPLFRCVFLGDFKKK